MWRLIHGVMRRDKKKREKNKPQKPQVSPEQLSSITPEQLKKILEEQNNELLLKVKELLEDLTNRQATHSKTVGNESNRQVKAVDIDESLVFINKEDDQILDGDITIGEEEGEGVESKANKLKEMLRRKK